MSGVSSRPILAWIATLIAHPIVNHLVDLWWIQIPLWAARRISRSLALVLADGAYLSTWPVVGAVAPPAAALLGLLLGWLRFAPGDTYTWSIAVMALMVLISGFGAGLGSWLWLGYVVGDFFLFTHPVSTYNHSSPASPFNRTVWGEILHVRVPLLQTYILLSVALIVIPLLSPRLQGRIAARWKPQSRQVLARLAAIMTALLQGLFVYVWTQVVPILSGPLYTWSRYGKASRIGYIGPPVEAMSPLERMGWVLVVLAAFAGGVRMVLQYTAAIRPDGFQTLRRLREGLVTVQQHRPWKLPAWAAVAIPTGFTAWMLAGLVDNVREGIGLVVTLACIQYAWRSMLPRMKAYVRLILGVPLSARIIAGLAISFLLGQLIIGAMWKEPYIYTWLPMLITVALSLTVLALLLPRAAGP